MDRYYQEPNRKHSNGEDFITVPFCHQTSIPFLAVRTVPTMQSDERGGIIKCERILKAKDVSSR